MFTLKGKTQRGKNVVQRDGARWWTCGARVKVQCLDNGPGLLIAPEGSTRADRASRWVPPGGGKDFEIIKDTGATS